MPRSYLDDKLLFLRNILKFVYLSSRAEAISN